MKKILFLLAGCLLLISCDKDPDLLIPASEVPKWLKERITADEKKIADDPQSGLEVSAWIRYSFEEKQYFEYHNALSSTLYEVYTFKGTMIIPDQEPYLDYQSEKSNMEFVWKGPNWIE